MWEGAGPAAEEAEEERREGEREEEGRKGAAALSGEPQEEGKEGGGAGLPSPSQRENGEIDTKLLGVRSAASRAGQRPAPGRGRGGEEKESGNSRSAVRWSPQRALGVGEMDARCLPPCVDRLRRADSGPLPLLAWLPAPRRRRARPPARPPRSFSPPLGGDGGPPGQGHQGCCSVLLLRSAALGALRLDLGLSAGLRSDSTPAAVLKGQLRDCCGAPRSRERVLRAGLRLRGRRALTPVPLRPACGRLLAVPAEARGPRRSDRGGGGGGSGRGEARQGW